MEPSGAVTILLCTCNGERYLPAQLDSIEAQDYKHWRVLASDDGSRDNTRNILEKYRRRWGDDRLEIFAGPALGYVANFLFVTQQAGTTGNYAWADQDDLWETHKLKTAVERLGETSPDTPALYCSRTRIVDADGRAIGFSPLFTKQPSFANALVQNIAGGNTMVFNNAARELLLETTSRADIVIHDWWLYLVVSGCGGRIHYDPHPTVRYRQHDRNEIGISNGWADRASRLRMMLRGRYKNWNDRNIKALQNLIFRLTPENRKILEKFAAARKRWLLPRLIGMKRSGVYRQMMAENLGLVAAVALKKI
ncbi:MAG: glycosyltransferase family 2 protein [Syntrophales bacterium]|jgi:glycosyltransferase involved in cell wall biosynthesis|nr:glycosyltransferase family 2 protein [Syntrophales bacterium]MDX9922889.1 glycosyltransferase family 2 protein [Syntrophales bacterium]